MHIVGSHYQAALAKGLMKQRMGHMLLVTVVMIVSASAVRQEVGLVILIVGIRQFQIAVTLPSVSPFQSSTISIEVIVVGVALTGTKEVAPPPYQCQLVGSSPRQAFLDVVGFLTI